MNKKIPFNKPYLTGKEAHYMYEAVYSGKISGNGKYTKKCQNYFEKRYGFNKCLLTTSCTDALEMAAILLEVGDGDEIILPSYTFVSTANAFELHGVKLRFTDSRKDHPGIDEDSIIPLISDKTKAIVVVHYAGVAVDMDKIMDIANKHNLYVVEDAAQAIDSYYYNSDGQKVPLGSIGHLATFSFHETKNIVSGEGGMLVINDKQFERRAEIIWEKGTNRSEFFRGEVDKYGWVDIGSSFLPSDIVAGFLYAQLEHLADIQRKRINLWNIYYENLAKIDSNLFELPHIPGFATNNGHMFYIVCKNESIRTNLIDNLKKYNIQAVFHYLSLHKSPYFKNKYKGDRLINSDKYSDRLLRLPMYNDLKEEDAIYIANTINNYYE